jgi:putative DNA primase/helicase
MSALRDIARALGGEVVGATVLAPGPNHSRKDRSLSVRLSFTAPDGFLAFSHAGDSWQDCRDHVRSRLGLPGWEPRAAPAPVVHKAESPQQDDDRIAAALKVWGEGVDPIGTPVETYLRSRRLELDASVAGEVLRWAPTIGAMLALFRSIEMDAPQAVSRTFLDAEGRKLERKFLGPTKGAAVKLDCDGEVTTGLHVGEGVETVLAARMLGLRPAWALGSAGAVAGFPVLSGIECLTILAEHDDASKRAVEACARRWHSAGREVIVNEPLRGKDLNDSLRRRA